MPVIKMTSKFLPCPFCGGEARGSRNDIKIKGVSEKCAWLYCSVCGCRTNYFMRSKDEHYVRNAIESWNRRWKE